MSAERSGDTRPVAQAKPALDIEIMQALQGLPDDQRREAVDLIYSRHEYHAGPLPDVQTFAGYGAVHPDAPREILEMAVRQQKHDIDMHSRAMRSEISYRNWTLAAATSFVLATIASATTLGLYGHDRASAIVGAAGGAAVVVGSLIRGRDLFPKSESPKPTAGKPGRKATVARPRARGRKTT